MRRDKCNRKPGPFCSQFFPLLSAYSEHERGPPVSEIITRKEGRKNLAVSGRSMATFEWPLCTHQTLHWMRQIFHKRKSSVPLFSLVAQLVKSGSFKKKMPLFQVICFRLQRHLHNPLGQRQVFICNLSIGSFLPFCPLTCAGGFHFFFGSFWPLAAGRRHVCVDWKRQIYTEGGVF